jgi:tartrate dehydratase beta subunit/fumarate hydratase class I family protein
MAAITADKIRDSRSIQNKIEDTFTVRTADTVYVGALVNFDTGGRVQSATAAASKRFAGVVEEIVNETGSALSAGTGNTAGTVKARVAWGHEVWVAVKTAARTFANLGKNVFISTNDDVTDTTAAGTATLRVKVGQLTSLNSAKTHGYVALRVFGDADAV